MQGSTVSRVLVLAGVVSLGAPARAAAEWQFAPLLGYTFNGSSTLIDSENAVEKRHWHFGGVVTVLGDSPLGIEGYVVRTPGFFHNDEFACTIETCVTSGRTYALMGNAVLAIPRRWNPYGLRPFVSGGIGLLHASRTDAQDITPINLSLLGMNVGGGAVGLLTDHVGVRFDLRYFRNIRGAPDDLEVAPTLPVGAPVQLRYWTLSLGAVFKY